MILVVKDKISFNLKLVVAMCNYFLVLVIYSKYCLKLFNKKRTTFPFSELLYPQVIDQFRLDPYRHSTL